MLMNVLTYVLNKYGLKIFLVVAVFCLLAIDDYEKRQELSRIKQELSECYREKEELNSRLRKLKSSKKGIVKPKRKNFIYEYEPHIPFFNFVIASRVWLKFSSGRYAHDFVAFDYDPVD